MGFPFELPMESLEKNSAADMRPASTVTDTHCKTLTIWKAIATLNLYENNNEIKSKSGTGINSSI